MNIRFIKLLIIISLVSVINSCNKCDKKTEPEKPESTPLESKKIEFDVWICHQFRTQNPNPGERKDIFISIKNPKPDKNGVLKNFKIEIKLDDLTLKQVLLQDADSSSGAKEDLDTATTVHFFSCARIPLGLCFIILMQ